MKLIFLDFDGVIVVPSGPIENGLFQPEPSRVRLLSWIIEKTDAEIVVSSCWRIGRTLGELQRVLDKAMGCTVFAGRVVGATPDLGNEPRGFEIAAYLLADKSPRQSLSAAERILKNEHYVVLDDNNDKGLIPARRWLRTKWDVGLTRAHAERAVRLLNAA